MVRCKQFGRNNFLKPIKSKIQKNNTDSLATINENENDDLIIIDCTSSEIENFNIFDNNLSNLMGSVIRKINIGRIRKQIYQRSYDIKSAAFMPKHKKCDQSFLSFNLNSNTNTIFVDPNKNLDLFQSLPEICKVKNLESYTNNNMAINSFSSKKKIDYSKHVNLLFIEKSNRPQPTFDGFSTSATLKTYENAESSLTIYNLNVLKKSNFYEISDYNSMLCNFDKLSIEKKLKNVNAINIKNFEREICQRLANLPLSDLSTQSTSSSNLAQIFRIKSKKK